MYSITKKQINNLDFDIITVKQEHIELTVSNYGCTIIELKTKDINNQFENIVMTYKNIESFIQNDMYLNSVVGPTAGRIKNATYSINNMPYHLDKNFFENENLHSGRDCFSFQLFEYKVFEQNNLTTIEFSLIKEDSNHYPGTVNIKVLYHINDHDFTIEYIANTDKNTILNLTNHAYFNLSGNMKHTVLNHLVTINASNVMTLDENNVPVGKSDVTNTYLDFRTETKLQNHYFDGIYETRTGGIDHPFLFDTVSLDICNATLYDNQSKRLMEVYTTYPAVVVYAHNFPDNQELAYNTKTQKHLGICFETQNEPNGINIPNCNTSILKKDEVYHHQTIYRFSVKEG